MMESEQNQRARAGDVDDARHRAQAELDTARKRDEEDTARRERETAAESARAIDERAGTATPDPYAAMTEQTRRLDAERAQRENLARERHDSDHRRTQELAQRERANQERQPKELRQELTPEHRDARDEREARGVAEERFRQNDRDYSRFYDAGDIEERGEQVRELAKRTIITPLEAALRDSARERKQAQEQSHGLSRSR